MKQKLIITEGIEGYWNYHLSFSSMFTKSLCGKDVMKTSLKKSQWGTKTHLNESYCDECVEIIKRKENYDWIY